MDPALSLCLVFRLVAMRGRGNVGVKSLILIISYWRADGSAQLTQEVPEA